jgi:outer membrane protein assembly factor BamA
MIDISVKSRYQAAFFIDAGKVTEQTHRRRYSVLRGLKGIGCCLVDRQSSPAA